jgi:hypothetical protein
MTETGAPAALRASAQFGRVAPALALNKEENMGHYCRICGATKSNESFSGKGHKYHVCKECAHAPNVNIDREEIIDEEFVYSVMFRQKNISEGNIHRLGLIATKYEGRLSALSKAIIEIGKIHPRRKNRIAFLYSKHRSLFDKLIKLGLIDNFLSSKIQEHEMYNEMIADIDNELEHEISAGEEQYISAIKNNRELPLY